MTKNQRGCFLLEHGEDTLEIKLPSIEDRGQTDRITILLTPTFNPLQANAAVTICMKV